jgi:nicotinamidase-related amidase
MSGYDESPYRARTKGGVLLVIDMQRAFDAPPWPRRWNTSVDENGLALLAAWRRRSWPIIHVRHGSVEPGSTLTPNTAGHLFREGFEPISDEPVVAKSVNAALSAPISTCDCAVWVRNRWSCSASRPICASQPKFASAPILVGE